MKKDDLKQENKCKCRDEEKAAEQYIIKLPNRENKSLYLGVFYYRLLIAIFKTLPIES